MGREWKNGCLGDIAEVIMGTSPRGETTNNAGEGVPLLNGPTEFTNHSPTAIQFTTEPVKTCEPRDILFCVRGSTTGRMNWADREYAIGRGLAAIRHRKGSDYQQYVRGIIDCQINNLLVLSTGSTFPSVSRADIEGIKVSLPPLPEQRAIAHILGTLDDKIELNRRTNETLEGMARALFKSWFIDFDPVRRNAARKQNQPSSLAPLPAGEGIGAGNAAWKQNQPSPCPGGEENGGLGKGEKGHYRGGYVFAGLVETARELRKKQTPAETIFWEMVRDRQFLGLKFRRQHQLGDYIADFYCHEHKLVVEFDGGVHSTKQKKDRKRDAWMETQGYTVFRFPNRQLLDATDTVLSALHAFLHPDCPKSKTICLQSHSSPSPIGRRVRDEGVIEATAFDHLFPDEFEDSELGPIPKGWEVKMLSELTSVITKGTTPTQEDIDAAPSIDSRVNFVRVNAMDDDGDILFDKLITIPESVHFGILKRSILQLDDVLYTIAGTIGRTSIVGESLLPANTNQAVAIIRPKKTISSEFLALTMQQPAFREELHSNIVQAVQANLSLGMLSKARTVIPRTDILIKLFAPIEAIVKRICFNRTESRTLAALRDALLPKLISGELLVKDTQRIIQEEI